MAVSDRERLRAFGDQPAHKDLRTFGDQVRKELRAFGDQQNHKDPFNVLRNYAADHPAPPSVDYYARAERQRIYGAEDADAGDDPLSATLTQIMAEIDKHALSATSCPRVFCIRMPRDDASGTLKTCIAGQLKGRGLSYDFETQRMSVCKPNPAISTRYTPPSLNSETHTFALRAWQKKRSAIYLPEMCKRATEGDPQELYDLTGDRYDDVEILDYVNKILVGIPFANPQGRGERTFLSVHATCVPPRERTTDHFGRDPYPAKLWATSTISVCDNDPTLQPN